MKKLVNSVLKEQNFSLGSHPEPSIVIMVYVYDDGYRDDDDDDGDGNDVRFPTGKLFN